MRRFFVFAFLGFWVFCSFLSAKNYKVETISQFNAAVKTVQAGDSIILANGIWQNVEFKLKAKGEATKQVYVVAETPGKVFIEGKSRLQMSGEYLFVSGLVFRNGYGPKSTVIEFRTSSTEYAYHSTLNQCVIDRYSQVVKDSADHWVGVYGKKNTVEYCYFGGKSNEGTTLVVWPNDSNSINNGHLIFRNYFGPRPRLGSNGGETIRIGTSQVCHLSSRTIVDGNYFERCNGETEIISNKSGDNIFVNNTFFESEGSLVLRHGNNAIVSGNWFIGNHKPNTGGVRVINEGHKIYNNYFYQLAGDEFRSGLSIMNAIPNSAANGYAPVRNVIFANNTYYDCAFPWAFGVGFGERDRIVKPESTMLLNNIVYCPSTENLIKYYDKSDGIRLDNNLLINKTGVLKSDGSVDTEILKSQVFGIDMVYVSHKAKKLPFVKYDILGQLRNDAVIGAFQNKGDQPVVELASAQNCGPEWYKSVVMAEVNKTKLVGKTITINPGVDVLSKAIKSASEGDVIVLTEGEYVISNKISILKDLHLKALTPGAKVVVRLQSEKANNSFFEIGAGAKVLMDGIAFNGDSKASFPAKYVFTSAKEGAFGYSFKLNNCTVYDVNTDAGAVFKAYKGSVADSIVISNSRIQNVFRGISLAEEKDDTGKYNTDNLVIYNTVFSNVSQFAVDYYRGGNDESTLGGNCVIDHCVFDQVGADEKQTILKLNGIVTVSISNSIFSNSLAKASVTVSGEKSKLMNCNFYAAAAPKIEKGAFSANLLFENPQFEKKTFLLSKKSKLQAKALDKKDIGLINK